MQQQIFRQKDYPSTKYSVRGNIAALENTPSVGIFQYLQQLAVEKVKEHRVLVVQLPQETGKELHLRLTKDGVNIRDRCYIVQQRKHFGERGILQRWRTLRSDFTTGWEP